MTGLYDELFDRSPVPIPAWKLIRLEDYDEELEPVEDTTPSVEYCPEDFG